MFAISAESEKAIEILEREGYEAYLAGGCVRDLLMGVCPSDWDICTSAKPEQTMCCFQDFPMLKTGLIHGTVTVFIHCCPLEITTYRTEGAYLDHRRPSSVHFVSNIEEDLFRRDFTINAMAYGPRTGLVDMVGGQKDLREKRIRCVGIPKQRFTEDALRIMRALRFSAVLDFQIEANTADAIKAQCKDLAIISVERIAAELNKLILGCNAENVLLEYGMAISVFLPEIQPCIGFPKQNPHPHSDVWSHTCKAVAAAPKDLIVRLALLFHDLGKPVCEIQDENGIHHFHAPSRRSSEMAKNALNRLKYSKKLIERVVKLVLYHDTPLQGGKKSVKRLLNELGQEDFRRLLQIQTADIQAQAPKLREKKMEILHVTAWLLAEILRERECFCLKDLKVDGNDLLDAGFERGPLIGEILNRLLQEVIEETLENEKAALLGAARSYVKMLD